MNPYVIINNGGIEATFVPLIVLALVLIFGSGWLVFYVGRALLCWIMDVAEDNRRNRSGRG